MGAFSQLEKELIRERTNVGLTAARQRGKEGGRPETHTQDKKKSPIKWLWKNPINLFLKLPKLST